jgi:drug/metabolite transporter (DMT)-like permease
MTSRSGSDKRLSPFAAKMLLVLLFVIWSNSFTAIKHLRGIFPPMELVLARFLPVSIFCAAFLLLSAKRRRESISILKSSWLKLAGLGLFGVVGYNYFLYVGQSEIKPGAAALLTTLAPLFTLLLAVPLLKERVPLRRTVGILIAFAGLYIVVGWGRVGLGRVTGVFRADIRYALVTALAPLSWSLYTIIGKDLVKRYSPVTVTYLSLVIGTIPLLLAWGPHFLPTLSSMGWTYWIALLYLALFCTIIGFWLWIIGLDVLPATSVASFIYLNPPLAALFGWMLFHEEITAMFLVGSAVVLAGLYLAQRPETGANGPKNR